MKRLKAVLASTILAVALVIAASVSGLHAAKTGNAATEAHQPAAELSRMKTYTPEQIRAALATLSDENARALLLAAIDRLAQEAAAKTPGAVTETGLAGIMQYQETVFTMMPTRLKAVIEGVAKLPAQLGGYYDQVTGAGGVVRLLILIGGIFAILVASYGLEQYLKRTIFRFKERLAIPQQSRWALWGGVALAALLSLLGIMTFALTSALLLLVFYGPDAPIRHLYGPIWTTAVMGRLAMLLLRTIFAPKQKELRLLHLEDASAQYIYRASAKILWILIVVFILPKWFQRIDLEPDSYLLVNVALGTLLLVWLGGLVWKNRTQVANYLKGGSTADAGNSSWFTRQFAAIWHILTLAYLFWVWFACASRVILFGPHFGGALWRSLLVVPLYLILDRLLQVALPSIFVAGTEIPDAIEPGAALEPQDAGAPAPPPRAKLAVVQNIIRAILFLVLLVWVLKAFNIELPFVARIAGGGFEISITIVLALVAWRWLNAYVTRKLAQTAPDPDEAKDDEDEFHGVVLDRSHTLLPMLRRFIGTVLLIMVMLIVLSSLGIDIGPLLAGAGVMGLAIGFGARKLVADVLSGFFYLLDDAFRVGEYIQAGGVSGTVEAISLRNAMIRHHLGSLQIVPYSNMGVINNSMRGPLVVKFNLDLPYDTDIEKVRKVVKKVGEKMINDPEYASDFTQPIKSQGVNKVGDSVMTFRVKFSAKPGKQFVIRREAFRLIKDALEAKGIHLAFRKVIVELPEKHKTPSDVQPDPAATEDDKLLMAGAAAALESELSQAPDEKSKKKS
jgi:small-conductance mechanosensitive channel